MPGTTVFPGALDTFPAIDANTQESAAGVEHDVVHANVHAAVGALEAKVGVDASADTESHDFRIAATENALLGKEAEGVAAGLVATHDADQQAHPEAVTAVAVVAGVATVDCSLGRFFALDLSADATLAIANPPAADCVIVKVTPSGGAVLTLPASCTMLDGSTFATGTAPFALGLMTLDGGASCDVVVAQP